MLKRLFSVCAVLVIVVAVAVSSVPVGPNTAYAQPGNDFIVFVLVVDDFELLWDEVRVPTFDPFNSANQYPIAIPEDELCYMNPEFLGDAISEGMGGGINGLTHGETVRNLILSTFTTLHGPQSSFVNPGMVSFRDDTLWVVDVPLANQYGSTSIGEKVTNAVNELQAFSLSNNFPRRYVINMSFALIPCDLYDSLLNLKALADQVQNNVIPRQDYDDALSEFEVAYLDWISVECTGTPVDCGDPLQTRLRNLDVDTSVGVAAAGNFGFDFPLMPAIWPEVISVSACHTNAGINCENTPLLDAFPIISNHGEIALPGIVETSKERFGGTSYAAPRLSAEIGMYLRNNAEICTDNNPPILNFAYADMNTGWDNLFLQRADNNLCGNFFDNRP